MQPMRWLVYMGGLKSYENLSPRFAGLWQYLSRIRLDGHKSVLVRHQSKPLFVARLGGIYEKNVAKHCLA